MSKLSKKEINDIARKFIELREASDGSERAKNEFNKYKNYCAKELAFLVDFKANPYRVYSNYLDIKQEGFDGLFGSLESYHPDKGDFVWWSSKYIKNKVKRHANTHSAMKIPVKKAREIKPCKVDMVPTMSIDGSDPFDEMEKMEKRDLIKQAISELPERQRKAILIFYDFSIDNKGTINDISKELKLSRPTCSKILNAAKENLRNKLINSLGY